MSDNPFVIETSGQADWDSALTANFTALERGYHVTERAGVAINTGQVLWLSSGGFFMPFDPNSLTSYPHAMAYTAAASGDSLTALAWGIVRSLSINSPALPGMPLYVSGSTPGLVVGEYAGATRQIGWGLANQGVLFQPDKGPQALSQLGDVTSTAISSGSFLGWSNVTSTWAAALPPSGGGGLAPGALPTIIQHQAIANTNLTFTFVTTPVIGNLVAFVFFSGGGFITPGSVSVHADQMVTPLPTAQSINEPEIQVYTRRVESGDGKVYEFHQTDGDGPVGYAMEIAGAASWKYFQATTRVNSNQVVGMPMGHTDRGNALGLAFFGTNHDCTASSVTNGSWTKQNSAYGGSLGGGSFWAVKSGSIGINSPHGAFFFINSYDASNYYPGLTAVFEPAMT